jgi:hypothetical protein
MVYHATVQSIIQYGITGWGGAYDTHIQKLATIQNTILKIILNKPYRYPTELVYEESGILQIRKLYAKSIIKHMHTNRNPNKTSITQDKIINTRSKTKRNAIINRVNKGLTQRHSHFLGPKLYNLIPTHIRQIKSDKHFKTCCKDWLKKYPINKIENCINNNLNSD